MDIEKVAIVGAGPAGIATAIQLERFGIHPLIFEGAEVGGLLRNANLVENYPGFPGGITGLALVKRMACQLKEVSGEVIKEKVDNLDFDKNAFIIKTPRREYLFRYVVIATGTKPNKPILPEISAEVRHYVFYEVTQLCRSKGKKIVIVGAGDAAFDYAINLSRANEVVILNRGSAVKCLPLLWTRAKAIPAISYFPGVVIRRVSTAGSEGSYHRVCVWAESGAKFYVDNIIFAAGREPQLDFFAENTRESQVQMIADGKLYFIGDVKNNRYRQTAIAVGDGVMAAMKIARSLDR